MKKGVFWHVEEHGPFASPLKSATVSLVLKRPMWLCACPSRLDLFICPVRALLLLLLDW